MVVPAIEIGMLWVAELVMQGHFELDDVVILP
jgi:hypothetical protein